MDAVTSAMHLADEFGWRMVPCYGIVKPGVCQCSKGSSCPSPGKHPIHADWGSTNSEQLFDEFSDGGNVGISLGPSVVADGSGIIDVEYDCDEGRIAVQEALAGIVCATPTYTSGRSTHRLFARPDDLPDIAKIEVDGIEFRLGGHNKATMSILPPSVHHTGKKYKWVEGLSPWEVQLAPLPASLMKKLENYQSGPKYDSVAGDAQINWRKKIQTTLKKPGRNFALFRTACGLFSGSFNCESDDDVASVLRIIRSINATQCLPPLQDNECVESVKHAVAKRRTDNHKDVCNKTGIEITQVGDVVSFKPDTLRLTIVTSDPVEYRLYSPHWISTTEQRTGYVSLTSEQFRNADKVADAVLEQTRVVCLDGYPDEWKVIWDGKRPGKNTPAVRGIKAQLLESAQKDGRLIDAPRTNKRHIILAQLLWERLIKAGSDDSDRPLITGAPRKLSDNAIWFRWESVWNEIKRWHQVTEKERREIHRRIEELFGGWPTKRKIVGSHKLTYSVWGPQQMHLLEQYQAGREDEIGLDEKQDKNGPVQTIKAIQKAGDRVVEALVGKPEDDDDADQAFLESVQEAKGGKSS